MKYLIFRTKNDKRRKTSNVFTESKHIIKRMQHLVGQQYEC